MSSTNASGNVNSLSLEVLRGVISLKNELEKVRTKDQKLILQKKCVIPGNNSTIDRTHGIEMKRHRSTYSMCDDERWGRDKINSASYPIQQSSKPVPAKNFMKLLNQIKALSVNTEEQMQSVVDLLYDKAVDDLNFSVTCALLVRELSLWQVPASITKSQNIEQQFINFRKLAITKCQIEFERFAIDDNARSLKLKEINECTDPKIKEELQSLFEEEDMKRRNKSNGNMRFIGELFKQQMLTVRIILRCMKTLLKNKNEDSLECLCILLTTAGKYLELIKCQNLQPYIQFMQNIGENKTITISNRVRCMLQDVIDLRSSKWVSKSELDNQITNYGVTSKPPPLEEMTLGSKNLFGDWGRNSVRKRKLDQKPAPVINSRSSSETQLNKDSLLLKEGNIECIGDSKNYEAPAPNVPQAAAAGFQQSNLLCLQNILEEYLKN